MKILEIYSEGDINCSHSFIYNPMSEVVISQGGLQFKTQRVCQYCGRCEKTLENMKHGKVDNYYVILSNFGLEVK